MRREFIKVEQRRKLTNFSRRMAGFLCVAAIFCLVAAALLAPAAQAQSVRPPEGATVNVPPAQSTQPAGRMVAPEEMTEGRVPGGSLGTRSDAEYWRAIRHGAQGYVPIPDGKAAILIQSTGEEWRRFRNSNLFHYGWWALAGMTLLCLVFYLVRGPIRIEGGRSGQLIERFRLSERIGHWVLAISFILLALTGLNMLYGKYTLLPLFGPEAFAAITLGGKWIHFVSAFLFMVGLAWVFVQWIAYNFPHWSDFVWLAKGGGFFSKHSHPPAKKFNAGQKIIFWLVVLGGISISLSGIALLLPFEFAMFSKTFAALNAVFGTDLPTNLSPIEEMQLSQLWHSIVALFLVTVIIAHIYIGTIGMEGGFEAMSSGKVDRNWAAEHHSLWVKELEKGEGGHEKRGLAQPAE